MDAKTSDQNRLKAFFHRFAFLTASAMGSAWAFFLGIFIVVVWAASGKYFHYSDTWQLVINTGTTIVTFLMVFLIQHTQNRDMKITQMKLDELIRAVAEARTDLIQMESLPDEELNELEGELKKERERAIREKKRAASRTQPGRAAKRS